MALERGKAAGRKALMYGGGAIVALIVARIVLSQIINTVRFFAGIALVVLIVVAVLALFSKGANKPG